MNDEQLEPDYEVRGELGRGGMSVVYLAEQLSLGREVAIKRALYPDDADAQLLLLREAMIVGQLEHPNIVPVHALLGDESGPAVVMKRLSGRSWEDLIAAADTPLERTLEILGQVLNAVAFAHSHGVLHRDIKPSNVMIGTFGEVYLVDWGMARRAVDPPSEVIVGTPRYMAPEMAEGQADVRTDVFLLGATLHHALTGEPRHRDGSALEVLYAAMNVEPFTYPPHIPEELAAICNRACAARLDDRFASVAELRAALDTFREHRAAGVLNDVADAELRRLATLVREGSHGYAEVQQQFTRARFGFEAALRIWPESPAARAGLERCLLAMVDYELEAQRVEAALALLESCERPDPERLARASALQEAQRRQRERALDMERDRDPRFGAPDRFRAYRALAIVTLAVTTTALVQRLFFAGFRPSTLRLTIVGGVLLSVGLAIVFWWRRNGHFNFINRRIAELVLSSLAVSLASRLSGFILGASVEQVLISDAFIIGLGGAAMSAYHRSGPFLALVSFTVAVVGSIWPSTIYDLFIALSVFIPLTFLLMGRVSKVEHSEEPTG